MDKKVSITVDVGKCEQDLTALLSELADTVEDSDATRVVLRNVNSGFFYEIVRLIEERG